MIEDDGGWEISSIEFPDGVLIVARTRALRRGCNQLEVHYKTRDAESIAGGLIELADRVRRLSELRKKEGEK